MRLLTAPEKQSITRRQAFSLVELMVVMVIIGILGALIAGVVVKAVSAQRTSTTLTTMEVIKSGLSRQLQEISDAARKAGKSKKDIYFLVRQAFPDSLGPSSPVNIDGEMISVSVYPAYNNLIAANSGQLATMVDDKSSTMVEKKSSFLLRMILDKGPKSKIDTDQLPKGALGLINGVNAVLDAWGDPIGVSILIDLNDPNLKVDFRLSSPNATLKN